MSPDPFKFDSPRYDTSRLKSCGDDVFVSANVEIRRPQFVTLGSHIALDSYLYLTAALQTGNYVHIGPHVSIIGGAKGSLVMGHFTNIAAGGTIVCVSDTFKGDGLITAPGIPVESTRLITREVVFEDFVNLGAQVTVLPGMRLAEGTVIGAGSVVTSNTEPWTIYVGSPARAVKERPRDAMLAYARELGYPFAE